jgi:hypothetical protein
MSLGMESWYNYETEENLKEKSYAEVPETETK